MAVSIPIPGPLVLSLSGIKNPISSRQLPTLQVVTYDQAYFIDSQTTNILIPASTVATVAGGVAAIVASPTDFTLVTTVMGTMATY